MIVVGSRALRLQNTHQVAMKIYDAIIDSVLSLVHAVCLRCFFVYPLPLEVGEEGEPLLFCVPFDFTETCWNSSSWQHSAGHQHTLLNSRSSLKFVFRPHAYKPVRCCAARHMCRADVPMISVFGQIPKISDKFSL
jgi:hypothetical protein